MQPFGFVFGAGSTETKKEEENHKEQDNKMNEKEVPEEADNCDSLEISKIRISLNPTHHNLQLSIIIHRSITGLLQTARMNQNIG